MVISRRFKVHDWLVGFVALAGLMIQTSAFAEVTYRAVVMKGERAPGTAADVVFDLLYVPVIDAEGRIAFRARLAGPGISPRTAPDGLWYESGGGVVLAVQEGEPAPGSGGTAIGDVGAPLLNPGGTLAFTTSNWVWSNANDTLGPVVADGDTAEGLGPG